ncbi:hypothetical protein H4R34_004615 [Dimargaris verticillata]|uniref:Ubiquitin-protein ligase E3A N-terminal zinc-binding domain-containing protein n=1 Tax=Dimargaris verticillata TaxID=2761393 RepID=A0A9W8EAZ8_9FUNG|nr:hypothetical protein H4R34_004615 [Dimargaris verticillata]
MAPPHYAESFYIYPHALGPAQSASKDLTNTDRLILPSAVLETLLLGTQLDSRLASNRELPHPLTFELCHPTSRCAVYGGVEEFTAVYQPHPNAAASTAPVPHGGPLTTDSTKIVFAPQWMLQSLALEPGDSVLLKLAVLPKATGATLRPLDAAYRDIPDLRATFEAHLRGSYTTLTAREIITVPHGKQRYRFLVEKLQPAPAVTVVDTDVAVDIEPYAEVMHASLTARLPVVSASRQPVNAADASASSVQELAWDQTTTGTVSRDQPDSWRIHCAGRVGEAWVTLSLENGTDADLLLHAGTECPTYENFIDADLGVTMTKQVHITVDPKTNPSREFRITVTTLTLQTARYRLTLSATAPPKEAPALGPAAATNSTPTADTRQCDVCHAWVPTRTFDLHHSFCLRHSVQCNVCHQVFQRGEAYDQHWHCSICQQPGTRNTEAKHMFLAHTPRDCPCGHHADSPVALAQHRRTECPQRMVICRYCHILQEQGPPSDSPSDRLQGLRTHEAYCGGRTIECVKCQLPVRIKDMAMHARMHDFQRQNQPLPFRLCRNANCVRPRAEGASQNCLNLCASCFGPFWIPNLDPGHKKLLQRMAHTYHRQLTQGCGRGWCQNPQCATATRQPLEPTPAARRLVPLVQNLSNYLRNGSAYPDPVLYLCVDEATTRRALLVQALDAEIQPAVATPAPTASATYPREWLVKALLASEEDVRQAKSWLRANAPRPSPHVESAA